MKEFIQKILHRTDIMKIIVGLSILLIYNIIVLALLRHSIPSENKEPIIHVLGTLDGVISMLVGYYFGSSKGSQDKTEIIKQQNEKINS